MKRYLLAVILGGLVFFIWGALAHEVLPLGELGVRALDNDQVGSAIKAAVNQPGFYIFPLPDLKSMDGTQRQQAMQQMTEKMKAGPTGIMVVYPQGREFVIPAHLAVQALCDFLTIALAAGLFARTNIQDYRSRITFFVLLALFPTLCVEVPQSNWYGFPALYTTAQLAIHLLGFLFAGLVVVKIMQPRLVPTPEGALP